MSPYDGPVAVAVVGSERRGGSTVTVVREAARIFGQHRVHLDVVELSDRLVRPCGPCGDCNTRREPCAVQDDVPELVQRMSRADGVLYALPVHGFGAASTMQSFIEKAGVGHLRFERPLANKVGGVVVVGRRYGHLDVVSQMYHNMLLNRMVLVGSGFPPVFHTEGREADPLADREGARALEAMVARMAEMMHLLRRAAADHEIVLPVTTRNERVR